MSSLCLKTGQRPGMGAMVGRRWEGEEEVGEESRGQSSEGFEGCGTEFGVYVPGCFGRFSATCRERSGRTPVRL